MTTLSGKGRLTHIRMKKWSSYYRKSIVENAPDVEAARHAVSARHAAVNTWWPSPFLLLRLLVLLAVSADRRDGPRCQVQACQAWHTTVQGCHGAVNPTVRALGQPRPAFPFRNLQTSNANESLHSTVWKRAPKSKYCGKKTTEIAVALAVMQYNKGAGALADAVSSLGVSFCFRGFSQNDIFTIFQICGRSPEKSYNLYCILLVLVLCHEWFWAKSEVS